MISGLNLDRKRIKFVWKFKKPKRRFNYREEFIEIQFYTYSEKDHGWKQYWWWDDELEIWKHPYDLRDTYCSCSYICESNINGKRLAKKIKS